jgi:GntR family transcriptional repressor for pyruvate dehydrogenase complex
MELDVDYWFNQYAISPIVRLGGPLESSAPIRPLPPRETAVGACAHAIRESILSGRLPPGSRLPPERALAVTLGVNRLTLRAALGQIATAGLLSVRQGSGYIVRDYAEEGGPDLIAPLIALAVDAATRREAMSDILLVRRALARAVIERVAERVNAPMLDRLSRAVDAFESAATAAGAGVRAIAQADQALVRAIVRETGSKVLALVANPVFRVAGALEPLEAAMYAQPAMNVVTWRVFVEALRDRDAEALERVLGAMAGFDEAVLSSFGPPAAAKKIRGETRTKSAAKRTKSAEKKKGKR